MTCFSVVDGHIRPVEVYNTFYLAVYCLVSCKQFTVHNLMCRDVIHVGTVCLLENSLLFCLTAHVTLVESGSVLPAAGRVSQWCNPVM